MVVLGVLLLVTLGLQSCSHPKQAPESKSITKLPERLSIETPREPTVVELLAIYANEEGWSVTPAELKEAVADPISQAMTVLANRNIFPAQASLTWPKIIEVSLTATQKNLRWSIATARSDRDYDKDYFNLPLTGRRESFSEPLSSILAAARLILQVQARPQLLDAYYPELSRLMEQINAIVDLRINRGRKSQAFLPLAALCISANPTATNCFTEAFGVLVGQRIIVNRARYAERTRALSAVLTCAMASGIRIRGIENSQIVHSRLVDLAKLYSEPLSRSIATLEERDLKATTEICF